MIFERELLTLMHAGDGLDRLAFCYTQNTGLPLAVVNSNFEVIASAGFSDAVASFTGLQNGDFLPPEFAYDMARKASWNHTIPTQIGGERHKAYLSKAVARDDEYYILSPAEDSRHEAEFRCVCAAIRTMLPLLILHSSFAFDSRKKFVSELLDGRFRSNEEIYSRAKRLGFPVHGPVSVIVGQSLHSTRSSDLVSDAVLSELFPGCCAVPLSACLVVLAFSPEFSRRDSARLSAINDYYAVRFVKLCVCPLLEDFSKVPVWYRNALRALDLCTGSREQGGIVFYEQYFSQNLLYSMSSDALMDMCNPELRRLYEMDISSGTDNVITLFTFLLCFGRMNAVSEALDISYNTVKNRLQVLDNLIRGSFEDYSTSLYISIRILAQSYPELTRQCLLIEQKASSIRRQNGGDVL